MSSYFFLSSFGLVSFSEKFTTIWGVINYFLQIGLPAIEVPPLQVRAGLNLFSLGKEACSS